MLIDKKARIYATMRSDEDDMRRISSLKYVYRSTTQRNFKTEQISAVEYEANKSFQHWSQAQNVQALAGEVPQEIPQKYMRLINKFPSILTCNFKTTEAKHGITHHIDTGTNKPCQAKVRPLMPGSPRAIQGEKNWRELERLGITSWTEVSGCVETTDCLMRELYSTGSHCQICATLWQR